MKPIYYGYDSSQTTQTLLIPTKEINMPLLEKAVERIALDSTHQVSEDKIQCYADCVRVYKTLFKHGFIPADQLNDFSNEILEIARDDIDDEMSDYIEKPYAGANMNYYYEYCRALAVAEQISSLTEFLDEESDFI